jgi:8-oxo-dGTP diphosphatase
MDERSAPAGRSVEGAPGGAEAARRYPVRPVVGVGAVVLTADGRVVLVRRGQPPLAGEWSLPGGMLEVGESLPDGVVREVREETGLDVDVGPFIDVFEHIAVDREARVEYHYVLLDYLCRARRGEARAASDVTDLAMAAPDDLERYALAAKARAVIARALSLAGRSPT